MGNVNKIVNSYRLVGSPASLLQKGEIKMFEFRLINLSDGNQIIDTTLKTPYDSITAVEMMEYMEVDARLEHMRRMERKQQREAERNQKFTYKFMHKVACMCGIM